MCLGPLVTARATGNWSRSAVRPARVKPTPLPANSTPFRPPRANVPLLSASPAICRFSLRGHCVPGQSAITTSAAANAIALCKTGSAVHGRDTIIERPDGSRIIVMVHIDPVHDEAGRLIGAINLFPRHHGDESG